MSERNPCGSECLPLMFVLCNSEYPPCIILMQMCGHLGLELHLFSCIDRREIFLDLLSREIFMYLKKLH